MNQNTENLNTNQYSQPIKNRLKESKRLKKSKNIILQCIDFFYFPFLRFIPLKTFRYAFCGGGNALLNLLIYVVCNHFIVGKGSVIDFGFFSMQYYTASFIIALCITFPIGFILNKFVVFQTSEGKGRVQLIKYGLMTGLNIFLNYALLHLLIGYWNLWPGPSQAFITVFLALLSYVMQNNFTFKSKK